MHTSATLCAAPRAANWAPEPLTQRWAQCAAVGLQCAPAGVCLRLPAACSCSGAVKPGQHSSLVRQHRSLQQASAKVTT